MNRDDDFKFAADDRTDSVLGLLFRLLIGISVDSLLSMVGGGAAVLDGVPRERPRRLNVGRVRNDRCVDVT